MLLWMVVGVLVIFSLSDIIKLYPASVILQAKVIEDRRYGCWDISLLVLPDEQLVLQQLTVG